MDTEDIGSILERKTAERFQGCVHLGVVIRILKRHTVYNRVENDKQVSFLHAFFQKLEKEPLVGHTETEVEGISLKTSISTRLKVF